MERNFIKKVYGYIPWLKPDTHQLHHHSQVANGAWDPGHGTSKDTSGACTPCSSVFAAQIFGSSCNALGAEEGDFPRKT